VFFDEWTYYLDELAVAPQQLINTGDPNFHLDKPYSPDIHQFSGLLESHGLVQHVRAGTHIQVHTLDIPDFIKNIDSPPSLQCTSGSVDDLISAYDSGIRRLTNKLAPLQVKTITMRPNAPWYAEDICEAKHKQRKAE